MGRPCSIGLYMLRLVLRFRRIYIYGSLLTRKLVFPMVRQRGHGYASFELALPTFDRMSMRHTPSLFLMGPLLRFIVEPLQLCDALVVVVHGGGECFLRALLANDELV